MINKYRFYRIVYPFASKRQLQLRQDRENESFESFIQSLPEDPCRETVAQFLWDYIRDELALVPDFRPIAKDSFLKIHRMHTDDLIEDILEPLSERCGLDVSKMNFRGQDLSLIDTPADINAFMSSLRTKA